MLIRVRRALQDAHLRAEEAEAARARLQEVQKELEEQQTLQEAVLQQLPVGVMIAEAESGRIYRMNLRAAALTGGSVTLSTEVGHYPRMHAFWPDGSEISSEDWQSVRALAHRPTDPRRASDSGAPGRLSNHYGRERGSHPHCRREDNRGGHGGAGRNGARAGGSATPALPAARRTRPRHPPVRSPGRSPRGGKRRRGTGLRLHAGGVAGLQHSGFPRETPWRTSCIRWNWRIERAWSLKPSTGEKTEAPFP